MYFDLMIDYVAVEFHQKFKNWRYIKKFNWNVQKHHANSYLVLLYSSILPLIARAPSFQHEKNQFLKKIPKLQKKEMMGEILIIPNPETMVARTRSD